MDLFPQPGRESIPDRETYFRQLAESMLELPGVVGGSYSLMAPVSMREFTEPVSTHSHTLEAVVERVGPAFFRVVGMRVLQGREFTWSDVESSEPVAVISESGPESGHAGPPCRR
jgi:hypothetical protein